MKHAILIAAMILWAIPVTAADKWTRVQSKNFTLAGNATQNEIRGVAEDLEVFRTAFSKFFKLKEGSSVATTVIVFKTDYAFKPFKPVYKGKPANVAGYFQQGQDTNFIALSADMQTPRVIYHELVHRLMSDNLGSLPLWFQEGFAECFSSIKIIGKDKKVQLGQALGEHVELLNQRDFMPLEKLFAVAHGSREYNEEEKQGLFYAESWAFVHYMMFNTPERRAQFMKFLDGVGNGGAAPAVFQQVFNTDLASFQKSFEAYILQRTAWNAFEMNTAGGLDRSKDLTARTLSEAESEFYLGDLLLHTNRLPEAESHLAKAIKLDPKLAAPQAAMGRLLMRNKKEAEALGYLQRATELDPGNYLNHYYYAALLDGDIRGNGKLSDADWSIMRSELQKAIELAPQFIEATKMLASNNLDRNTDIPQTVDLLANAVRVAPGDDYLVVQLAFALTRTQNRESARPLLRSLLAKSTLEPSLRQNVLSLIEFLDRAAGVNTSRALPDRPVPFETQVSVSPEASTPDASTNNPPVIRRGSEFTPAPVIAPPDLTKAERDRIQVELKPLPDGARRIRGVVTSLDCSNALTLSVVVDGKTVKLHTARPNTLNFTSANPSVSNEIACGPTPGNGVPAVIDYRPQSAGESIGEPISVVFVQAERARVQNDALPAIAGTEIVKGLLTNLECTGGVTIEVISGGKPLKFSTVSANTVAFLNGPNSDGTVDCGPMPAPGLPVTVLYNPSKSGSEIGTPVVIQFQR